jgi:peptidylprolyl isomerase
MITPVRVFIVAMVLGVGTAVLMSMNAPLPPQEAPIDALLAPAPPSTQPAIALAVGKRTITNDNLMIIDVKEGDGPPVKAGDVVTVNFVGRLYYGGKQFQASADYGKPWEITVGAGQAIKGVDEGLVGMKVGGKRQLLIPPDLAYGQDGVHGLIPSNATLVFDLELVKDVPAPSQGPMQVPQP